MATRYDYTSKQARKLAKLAFKGQEGREYRQSVVDFLRDTVPLTEAYGAGREQLAGMGGLLQSAISSQQSVLPAAQQAVQQGLAGNFFDIAPWQAYAERNLHREQMPGIAQTFATLGTPLSSDTTGQLTNAIRDTYLDLAMQGAGMNFAAKNALINEGGLQSFLTSAQQPFNTSLQGTQGLFNADLQGRQAEASARPGAASLFPSFVQGGLAPLAGVETSGRISEGV